MNLMDRMEYSGVDGATDYAIPTHSWKHKDTPVFRSRRDPANAPRPEKSRLWSDLPAIPEEIIGCDLHILGDVDGQILGCAGVIQAIAANLSFDVNVPRGLSQIPIDATRKQFVTVQVDNRRIMGQTIDLLMNFRRRNPFAVVVAGSRYFVEDDLSQERFAISDASLRTPSTPESMVAVFMAAKKNNKRMLHIS
ncbi:hypothetical protein [Solirhodobacter olei]|uniref:hypothetical protein n=1 Tax=Solirhodobacter olei TaxID=2493082 RepID=UPI000FDBB82A|nr:hypothetical protein [Solirhodobacter olei]